MRKKLSLFITLSYGILILCSGQNTNNDLGRREWKNNIIHQTDSLVVAKMNTYNIPGLAIGLVVKDTILYAAGYGIKNIKNPHPVTENTIFHSASVSKLLTAQAIIMLVENGEISLNQKLLTIAPELNYKDQRVEDITVLNLLNHTSGLPDVQNYHWKNNNQSDKSLEDYMLNQKLKLKSEPSTQYNYSNLGYNILGYIVEKIESTSFDVYMKENVLDVYGMKNSDFRYFKIPDSLKTSPHSKRVITGKVYERKTYPYTREQAPGSTLNSSVTDLSNWMISFMNLLNKSNSDNVFVKMIEPSFNAYPYIGLGFQLGEIQSKKTIGHFGGDKGFRSYLLMIPEEKIGLVLLTNCDYEEDFRQEILHQIAEKMLTIGLN